MGAKTSRNVVLDCEDGKGDGSQKSVEEIVISGMAGKFPNTNNIYEFSENLYNKVDMVDDDTRRWDHNNYEIPKFSGKLYDIDKFDAAFFGIPQLQTMAMDPMCRLLLERTFEAIAEAGLSLVEVQGTKTGVFVAISMSETENSCFDRLTEKASSITGCLRSMLAVRISYFFKLQGPSYVVDTACSSSLVAFEHGFKAIREGICEYAIVGGANLCLNPLETLKTAKLGVLSSGLGCRAFDDSADGYTRSEAIGVLFLQKAKNARRILAKVVHAKVNSDGFKELGITYPSVQSQQNLISEMYQECNILPDDVTYIEAHGTGTTVGDYEELRGIESFFCKNRKTPLLIGSVKSSIGHTESVSGICSIIKILIGMENERIPPTIKYKTPRKGIESLQNGQIKVVTESENWPNNKALAAINSFGFGGANAHVILEWNKMIKNKVLPDDLPRLITISGRTAFAVESILNDVSGRKYNVEFIRLLQEIFKFNIQDHNYRGFSLITKEAEIVREEAIEFGEFSKMIFIFGEEIENPYQIISKLSKIPKVKTTIQNLYMKGKNINIQNIYSEITFPVSRGNPLISPLIKWNHDKSWYVTKFTNGLNSSAFRLIDVNLQDDSWKFLNGHVIDGEIVFPSAGYLYLVWSTFSSLYRKMNESMKVVFENVKFHRETTLRKDTAIVFAITIHKGTGTFEVAGNSETIASGRIHEALERLDEITNLPQPVERDEILLKEHDIYKEFKLRGYQYKGTFKGIEEYKCSVAKLRLQNNWAALLENYFQVKIFEEDTRNLYVPTGIERMIIDAKGFKLFRETFTGNNINVYTYKDLDIIRSDYIEITGLKLSPIYRNKNPIKPILENYQFVPNEGYYTLEESLRINIQIIVENVPILYFNAVEIHERHKPLSGIIYEILKDIPLVQPGIKIFSNECSFLKVENKDISVEDKDISAETNLVLIFGHDLLMRVDFQNILNALSEKGFILTIESSAVNLICDLTVITSYKIGERQVILLKKPITLNDPVLLEITESMDWLPRLQTTLKRNTNIILTCQNLQTNGLLGFINCLKKEPNTRDVRCLMVIDEAPKISLENKFYKEQMRKGLAINIYKDGNWGTYRHFPLSEENTKFREHTYLSALVPGDESTLNWVEGPLKIDQHIPPGKNIIKVHYASLEVKVISTTSGGLLTGCIKRNEMEQDYFQGIEFSGTDKNGNHLMGMVTSGALSTLVVSDEEFTWKIPESWSLEEAATVPVAYSAVLYGLLIVGRIKSHSSILIHCGNKDFGQAAINVALHYGCKIFVAVESAEEKALVKKYYPEIKASCIDDLSDIKFQKLILKETNGLGADVILVKEKIMSSVRCLAKNGTFLQMNDFDFTSNDSFEVELCNCGASFHGITLDLLLNADSPVKSLLSSLVNEGIKLGYIKPLPKNVFKMERVQEAYQFMNRKHFGKVLIKIRSGKEEQNVYKCIPRFYCETDKVYLVIGGLGGFGLELVNWMIKRGARKLVLTSRSGAVTGYQKKRLNLWSKHGAHVLISNEDCSTKESCRAVISKCNKLGEIVSIFNLAVEIKDAIFENMTVDHFERTLKPKYLATKHLDEISRYMCPNIKNFIVFSSITSGRGYQGQTNYGMSNSFMERICELRRKEGLPAQSIQWGPIGDVGLLLKLFKKPVEIGGTIQQGIRSCLDVLDNLINQNYPIVTSIVLAKKCQNSNSRRNNSLESILHVLGIRNVKTVSLHATLPELGMDSVRSVEINLILEKDYNIFLTSQELRTLTFSKLMELEEVKENGISVQISEDYEENLKVVFEDIGDENMVDVKFIDMESAFGKRADCTTTFILPGFEGVAVNFVKLAKCLQSHVLAIQYLLVDDRIESIQDLAQTILPTIDEKIIGNSFQILTHSFGIYIALELIALLEQKEYQGKLVIIDGAPDLLTKLYEESLFVDSKKLFETSLVCTIMSTFTTKENIIKLKNKILNCSNYLDRVNIAMDCFEEDSDGSIKKVFLALYKKIELALKYKPSFDKLKCKMKLYKPSKTLIANLPVDYNLGEYFQERIDVAVFDGNHETILLNESLANDINDFLKE